MTLKITVQVAAVLTVLASSPDREWYALEISNAAGLMSGTVNPIMKRLLAAGWVTDRREDIDPRAEGRPARRYYRLAAERVDPVRALLAARGTHLVRADQAIQP